MALGDALLPEFDHEMANTRKTLERVPDDKLGWTPVTVEQDSYDVATNPQPPELKSRSSMLENFDKNVAAARASIAKASDEQLKKPWSLLKSGQAIFTQPRIALLRGFIMNHLIHHRAQLGVYLRLNDIPVPSIYGPSADEGIF